MTALERRLASELRDAANDIEAGSVPPLVLPSGPGRSGLGRARAASWRHRAPRMLAPLAAAASVLAIVAGVAVLGSIGRSQGGRPAASSVLRSVPRYYVALTGAGPLSTGPLDSGRRYVAGIYATTTGALIARVAVPAPYRTFIDVSAAADDRTFAFAARAHPRSGPVMFYLGRFTPGARSVTLTTLSAARMPAEAAFDGLALSPDGRELAIAYEQSGPGGFVTEVLKVVDVASGTVWNWKSTQGSVAGAGLEPHPLSWSAGDRTLGFAWHATAQAGNGTLPASGVRLLRIASRVPGLVASSRLSVRLNTAADQPGPTGLIPTSAMLAPGGRVVAAAGTGPSGAEGGFREFSAVTGRPTRTLWWKPIPAGTAAGDMAVLWVSSSGTTLVVSNPPGHPGKIGVLRQNRLILLPASAKIALPAAAW